ncbi:MAG TPA: hypothetical protein VF116_08690 [Ktedonobacterales bacterium]
MMADTETGAPSAAAGSSPSRDDSRSVALLSGLAAFCLGVLAAICWLAALLLDFQTTKLSGWAREAPHAALVLAVPALVILVAQARNDRQGNALRWCVTVLALLMIVVASAPGLLLVAKAQDLVSLPLRIPTLGLGVVLGYTMPFERSADGQERRGRAAAAGGAGFALLLAPVAFVLVTTANAATPLCPPPPAQVDCGTQFGVGIALEIAICGTTLLALLLALAMAALGGVIGRALGRIGR